MEQFDINDVFFNLPQDNKKTQVVACDFETTVRPDTENVVYMWSIVFKDKDPLNHSLFNNKWIRKTFPNVEVISQWKEGTTKIQGLRISDFIKIANSKKARKTIFYFHNGAKFDGSYIFKYLINEKYRFRQDLKVSESFMDSNDFQDLIKYIVDKLLTDKQQQKAKELEGDALLTYLNYFWTNKQTNFHKDDFSILLKDNSYYQILLSDAKFWDSAKMFQMSIKDMGETLNKDFNTNEYGKDVLETKYTRLEEYKDIAEAKSDANEWPYNGQDSFVLWKFLTVMMTKIPHHLWKMTSGSTAYNLWKDWFCEERYKELKDNGLIIIRKRKWMTTYWTREGIKIGSKKQLRNWIFELYFPEGWIDLQTFRDMKRWYRGGITQNNPLWQGLYIWLLCSIDLNSSYGAVMASLTRMLPYGLPIKGYNKLDFNKWQMMTLRINDTIINKYGMPFLTESASFKSADYQAELYAGQEFHITTAEYKRFLRYYTDDESKFSVEINWTFDCVPANKIFGPLIQFFYKLKNEAKMNNDEALKTACKIFLNSIYGKFGTKREVVKKFFDENGIEIGSIIDEMDEQFYLPLGIAITSEARMTLIDGVGYNYKWVIYCDTDSLYIITPYWCTTQLKTKRFIEMYFYVETDHLKLGAWDIEKYMYDGFFRRPKTYAVRSWKDNHWDFKIAGLHIGTNEDSRDFQGLFSDKLGYADFIFGFKKKEIRPDKKFIVVYLKERFQEIKEIWTDKPKREQIHWRTKDNSLICQQLKQIDESIRRRQEMFN